MLEKLKRLFQHLKDFLLHFAFKFFLGLLDVMTDLVVGHNLIAGSGAFLLGSYIATSSKEEKDHHLNDDQDYTPWGILTILLVWFPGLMRILALCLDQTWKGIPTKSLLKTFVFQNQIQLRL